MAGPTVFARYAFNELVSFIAGWAILLDYVILIAVTCYSATQYLRVFWHPLGHRAESLLLALAFIAFVVLRNIRGFNGRRSARRIGLLAVGDLGLQLLIVVLGWRCSSTPTRCSTRSTSARRRRGPDLVFALTVTTIAFTSLESASGLAGEVRAAARRAAAPGRQRHGAGARRLRRDRRRRRHSASRPRHLTPRSGGRYRERARARHRHAACIRTWLREALSYVVGAMAAVTLVAAANSAMLGLSRLALLAVDQPPDPQRPRARCTPSAPRPTC